LIGQHGLVRCAQFVRGAADVQTHAAAVVDRLEHRRRCDGQGGIVRVQNRGGRGGDSQPRGGEFAGDLVHRQAGRRGPAADEGSPIGFEEVLQRSPFAPPTVQNGKDDLAGEVGELGRAEAVDDVVVDDVTGTRERLGHAPAAHQADFSL